MFVITGASRGIGKFLAEYFASLGEKVIGVYKMTQPEIIKNVQFFQVDIAEDEQVKKWVDTIKPDLSKIVLINAAGSNYTSFGHKSDILQWKRTIDVNLIGTFNVIHHFLSIMREQNYGRIINFSSVVAQMGIPGASAYAASKAGLWGLAKSLAVENASKGITINTMNLGYFNIGMINEVRPEFQENIKTKIPVGKFGDPVNILNAIKFMIDSPYMTGSTIDVNGGLF
jgi:NAD(P)-dependent dehydrogenase (short-subunit alcohol dehydrogenase family)